MKYTIVALLLMTTVVHAEENIKGVWSTQEGCDYLAAVAKDPNTAFTGNFDQYSYLSSTGIEGYEWGCRFVQSNKGEGGETLIISTCYQEGDEWPELIMLKPIDKGWIVSTKGTDNPNQSFYSAQCQR